MLNLKRSHSKVNADDLLRLKELLNEISTTARHFGRGLVGFSTGCLYQSNLDLLDKLKIFLRAGSTVLELSFATLDDLLTFEPTEADISKFRKFTKITIHAPWKGLRYFDGSPTANLVISKLLKLNELFYVTGVVVHPDIVDNFNALELTPLPILIENMDINKAFGISAKDIEMIKTNYDFGFVLDLQHAFEHDHSLSLARELISVMGDRLRHLYVSGQTQTSRHAPVYLADNKMEICQLLRVLPNMPVVLEGVILDNISVATETEITYVIEQGSPLF